MVEAATITLESYLVDYCSLIVFDFRIYPQKYPHLFNASILTYQIKKAPGSKENPSTLPLLPCHDINQSCGEGVGVILE